MIPLGLKIGHNLPDWMSIIYKSHFPFSSHLLIRKMRSQNQQPPINQPPPFPLFEGTIHVQPPPPNRTPTNRTPTNGTQTNNGGNDTHEDDTVNGTIGTGPGWVQNWDDGWNGQDPQQGQMQNAYGNPRPNLVNNGQPMPYGGCGFPHQPMDPHHQQEYPPHQGYPHQQGFYMPQMPPMQAPNYGPGIPIPPPQQNMGVPRNYNQGMMHAQAANNYFQPALTTNASPVVTPVRNGRSYEVRPAVLTSIPTFNGRAIDEPYPHLQSFEQFCQVTGLQGFTSDEVKLILFSFSLKDRAKNGLMLYHRQVSIHGPSYNKNSWRSSIR